MNNYFVKARDLNRINIMDVISSITDNFYLLKGDKINSEDEAIIGGIGKVGGKNIIIIGHNKGHNFQESQKRNYGMPSPGGFRKAVRLMKLAEKFKIPVLTLIDTPGAFPGKDAEENGQSIAISESLLTMAGLETPVIGIVLSEGSSGGALGLGLCDKVYMLEHAVYSILSPEGFAQILYKDESKVDDVIDIIKARSSDLLKLGVIDGVIKEDDKTIESIKKTVLDFISKNSKKKNFSEDRIKKFRRMTDGWH